MKLNLLLSALLMLILVGGSTAQMSGAYTVDPAGSGARNYKTLAAATAAIRVGGVNGPVVFTVASVTFPEAMTVYPAAGMSAGNTVTFTAVGSPAVINAKSARGLTLQAGSKHYIFANLKITGATSQGIYMAYAMPNRVTFCTFKNVEVDMPATPATSVNAVEQQRAWDITYEFCKFAGGGRTLYTQVAYRCTWRGCEFDGKRKAFQVVSPWNANNSECLFENCFIHDCEPSGYAIHLGNSGHGAMFWHNTIIGTSTRELVLYESCCAWTRANSFRNNIVVQNGSGACLAYGYNPSTSLSGPGLDFNDLDYNCYYHPNTGPTVKVQTIPPASPYAKFNYSGNLAGWKTHAATWRKNQNFIVLRANPSPALKDIFFDNRSIEADPGLVSMTAPYDIHLLPSSTCRDVGTTRYVAHILITPFPLTYRTVGDFEGEARPATRVDIGADEAMSRMLTFSGTGKIGTAVNLSLDARTGDAGLRYQLGSSFSAGPIPIDTRKLSLGLDDLLDISVRGLVPMIFAGYSGVLDANGKATAVINLPNIPALDAMRIHTAFVTVKVGAPSNIRTISNTVLFTVVK